MRARRRAEGKTPAHDSGLTKGLWLTPSLLLCSRQQRRRTTTPRLSFATLPFSTIKSYMLYNIEEKAPLVAEPSHRLIPLELSRSRRDSGGAHTVIEVLAGALEVVAAVYRDERSLAGVSLDAWLLSTTAAATALTTPATPAVVNAATASPAPARTSTSTSETSTTSSKCLFHLFTPFPRIANPPLPCGQLTPWWWAGRCYLRRVTLLTLVA